MQTFRVYMSRTWTESGYVCIDAESEDEAREKALNKEYDDEDVNWSEMGCDYNEQIDQID